MKSIHELSQWDVKNIKLSILVPTRDTVSSHFSYCLTQLVKITTQVGIDNYLFFNSSSILLNQREGLIEEAKKVNSDYVLLLDSDMIFPPTTAIRLMNHNVDIVGCNYMKRSKPIKPVAYEKMYDWENPLPLTPQEELVKVEAVGLGCMLIKMDVFKSINKPYFEFTYDVKSKSWIGEDFNLLNKFRNRGYEVNIDTVLSNEIKHVGSYAY